VPRANGQNKKRVILALFLSGLLFRLPFLLIFGVIDTPDTIGYLATADEIAAGRFYDHVNETFRLPGYPLLVAFILWLPRSLEALLLVQVVLSAAAAILIYLAADIAFNERAARLGGWLVALNPALAYYSVVLLPETLTIHLVALATWSFATALQGGQLRWFGATGVVLALLVWTKAILLVLIPAFLVAAWLTRPPRVKRGMAVLIVPVLVLTLGWTAHNTIRHGFSGYSPGLGLNLLERTIYLDAPDHASPIKDRALREYAELKEMKALGSQADALYYSLAVIHTWRHYRATLTVPELDQLFLQVAWRQIREDPVGYLTTTAVEFGCTWAGYTPHWAKWRPTEPAGIPDWSYLVLGPVIGGIMLSLTVYGSVQAGVSGNRRALAWILPVFLVTLASSLVSASDYRFRLPVEPLILSLVGYAIVSMAEARR